MKTMFGQHLGCLSSSTIVLSHHEIVGKESNIDVKLDRTTQRTASRMKVFEGNDLHIALSNSKFNTRGVGT